MSWHLFAGVPQQVAGRRSQRTSHEAAATELAWLNKGIFISVSGRSGGGVAYDTCVVVE